MIPFDTSDTSAEPGIRHRAGMRSYSQLQLFFLLRLARLLRERQVSARQLSSTDWRMKLLNKSIYSTFCDCVEQSVAEDARGLFEQNRASIRA
jgi:hypothetical protein